MSNAARVFGAASNTLETPLNVEDVFSTYLYTGTGGNATITNGIDLAGEGGLVITKRRNVTYNWGWFDTERGVNKAIHSNDTDAEETLSDNGVRSFNSNGFGIGDQAIINSYTTTDTIASWTFRKAPKFFDIVTYTGTGAARTMTHDLDSEVGMIIVKPISATGVWRIWVRGFTGTERLQFDTTAKATTNTSWDGKTPTTTEWYLGADTNTNNSGTEYVAYLFAHNDGDGLFGPTGDQDIIKVGSYEGASPQTEVDLGFEPQFLLVKNTDATAGWFLLDDMRGIAHEQNEQRLQAHSSAAEDNGNSANPTSTGFLPGTNLDALGQTYIYIAIRRGPMAVPESATDVFAIDTRSGSHPSWTSGFPVDFALRKEVNATDPNYVGTRLTREYQPTNSSAAAIYSTVNRFDSNTGWSYATVANSNYYSWMWRRAPKYFDVVAYTGNNNTTPKTHNLGVTPEMIWVKNRTSASYNWYVWHKDIGDNQALILDTTSDAVGGVWNNTAPTSTGFTVAATDSVNGGSSNDYVAYLFASLAGISKVGSFTSDGTDMTIDCGFTAGARFVLLKRYNTTDDWFFWDSVRGITSGADPRLKLNSNAAEASSADNVGPDNSGFIVKNNILGGSGNSFIFYAIA